jgi:hypothetical protein
MLMRAALTKQRHLKAQPQIRKQNRVPSRLATADVPVRRNYDFYKEFIGFVT